MVTMTLKSDRLRGAKVFRSVRQYRQRSKPALSEKASELLNRTFCVSNVNSKETMYLTMR